MGSEGPVSLFPSRPACWTWEVGASICIGLSSIYIHLYWWRQYGTVLDLYLGYLHLRWNMVTFRARPRMTSISTEPISFVLHIIIFLWWQVMSITRSLVIIGHHHDHKPPVVPWCVTLRKAPRRALPQLMAGTVSDILPAEILILPNRRAVLSCQSCILLPIFGMYSHFSITYHHRHSPITGMPRVRSALDEDMSWPRWTKASFACHDLEGARPVFNPLPANPW